MELREAGADQNERREKRRGIGRSTESQDVASQGNGCWPRPTVEQRARGLEVPRYVSVIGCGDTNMGQYVDPPLTTVRMPFAEMGETAARNLLLLIAGHRPPDTVVLPHQLVIRRSVGPPRIFD